MLRTIGIVVTTIGLLGALTGWLWNSLFPAPDANIGAGALVVLGLPVAGIGLVLLIIGIAVRRR